MNLERVDFVLDVLRNLPAEREFTLLYWGLHHGAHSPEEQNFCGTSACAIGWVALDPRAKDFGMLRSWDRYGQLTPIVNGRLATGASGIAEWLDLPCHVIGNIFYMQHYAEEEQRGDASRRAVIARLEQVREANLLKEPL